MRFFFILRARDRGSELPEQQQAWAKKELGTAGAQRQYLYFLYQ
jgi:hypothetical protein